MEYILPVGAKLPEASERDVSKDIESAKEWVRSNVKKAEEVHDMRERVQKQFKSLTNDEAFEAVMHVKKEWDDERTYKDEKLEA